MTSDRDIVGSPDSPNYPDSPNGPGSPEVPMRGSRIKPAILCSLLALGAMALLAWTQLWFGLTLDAGQVVTVPGQAAAPALGPLGVATGALAGALSIARHRIRIVLGLVQSAIGGLTVVISAVGLTEPIAASGSSVTAATGVSGSQSIAALILDVSITWWPWVAVAAGVAMVISGVAVAVTSRRWRRPARRFDTGPGDDPEPAVQWDLLSDGGDPTAARA